MMCDGIFSCKKVVMATSDSLPLYWASHFGNDEMRFGPVKGPGANRCNDCTLRSQRSFGGVRGP
jgi:hypothetical protein